MLFFSCLHYDLIQMILLHLSIVWRHQCNPFLFNALSDDPMRRRMNTGSEAHKRDPNLNPLRPTDAYIRHQTRQSLVQIIACRLFGAKLSSEPMLDSCQLDHKEHYSVKFQSKVEYFHSRKCVLECRLQKWRSRSGPQCVKPPGAEAVISRDNKVNTMAAKSLATFVARSSANMI